MSSQELLAQLLALPKVDDQKRYLQEHATLLDDQTAKALKKQADQFLRSDVQRSLETAELLQYVGELTEDPLCQALGLLAEANARTICLGEHQAAVELYDQASEIYQAQGHLVRQARSQIGKIVALSRMGRHSEAFATGEWASRVLEEHDQWRPLADLTLNLGALHGRLGDHAQSLLLFDRARELYCQLGKEGETYLPWIDHDRAIALSHLGQFEESIQVYQQARDTLDRRGQGIEAARVRQNLAVTYIMLSRYNEGLELLDRAMEVFLEDGRQRDAFVAELLMSDCLLQLRRFADVLTKCRNIRAQFTGLGARFEAALALVDEAVAYAGLDHYDQAMESLAEARRFFSEEGSPIWVASTDLERAALLLRQGRYGDSLATARQCMGVFDAHGLLFREAQARLVAARAAVALKQDDQARRLVAELLALAQSQDIPSLTCQAHHLLGSLAAREGDLETAMTQFERAILELERLRGRLMVEFRVDFLEDKQGYYADMVRLCLDTARPQQALEYAERAKSRALVDLLAHRLNLRLEARRTADHRLVDELVQLRAQRDRLYRRWEVYDESGKEDRAAASESRLQARLETLDLERQITDLWHRLLIRDASYAQDASLWQVRTEPVQPHLAPGTMLLEYFFVHQQIIAFLVTPESVQIQELPADLGAVQRLIRLLRLNFRSVPRSTPAQISSLSENARGLLGQLHKVLIAPLGDALAGYPQLIVVPHGPLHYLPFQALHDGESFLVEQHGISYLPGASVLVYCLDRKPTTSSLLSFGHSYGGRLPHTIHEARTIAELLDDRAFIEEEATLEELRARAHDSRVIHLATHGEFRPDNPLFSGLALDDGWLTTLDIFGLPLDASLVTLSACQTGQKAIGPGDELLGLMRAFLYAGAASVVLSLWTVADRSTAGLMGAFYRKLAEGQNKGSALRQAQLQLLNGQGKDATALAEAHAHPYFWAPFCLVGDAGAL
jgi:CHAT domain-containing protein